MVDPQNKTGTTGVMPQARSYKFRLRPTASQIATLSAMLADFCGLYNACLQQRQEAYHRHRRSRLYADQAAELKAVRAYDPNGIGRWSFTALQQVLRRVDQTYTASFKRGRGFPRYRASVRYHADTFRVGDGLSFKGPARRLGIVGVPGSLKVVWHRTFPPGAKLGTAVITRQGGKWYAVFSVEAEFGGTHGVDLGLTALFAMSDGHRERAPRLERRAHKAQRRQRALARCQRGSKRRARARARLAAGAAKIARQTRDLAHKVALWLVCRSARIAFEDLNIAGMVRSRLARSIHDAA